MQQKNLKDKRFIFAISSVISFFYTYRQYPVDGHLKYLPKGQEVYGAPYKCRYEGHYHNEQKPMCCTYIRWRRACHTYYAQALKNYQTLLLSSLC